MRLIKSNNIESEYPKRHVCGECGAELEYDKEDVHIGWMGCEYVTCPACDSEIAVSDRVHPPAWTVTFHHTSVETGAKDIEDVKIKKYIDKTVKCLCSDEWKPGEFALTGTGNLLVFGVKWGDGVNIYVTQDYWEDSIAPEDYGLVK
jgi:DNA-directed RNA polymerase subunit RPC12/RpoP